MPRSTVKFQFEFTIWGWASEFSETLTGENRAFLIIFNSDQSVDRAFFSKERYFDNALKESLTKTNEFYFFYDPFEGPEYTYISWNNLSRNT